MQTRRALLGAVPFVAAGLLSRRVHAEAKEPEAHPVDPPPSLELRTLTFEKTMMSTKPVVAIAAIPRARAEGERFPLVVLLPGGIHTKQKPSIGCWGWWSDSRSVRSRPRFVVERLRARIFRVW